MLTTMKEGKRIPTETLLERLDSYTPVGRNTFELLPKSERVVLANMCEIGKDCRYKDLEKRVRRDPRHISMSLTRLKKRGLIKQVRRGIWEVVNPYLVLWYRFRRGVLTLDDAPSDGELYFLWPLIRKKPGGLNDN